MPIKKHQSKLLPRQLPLLDNHPEYGWLLEKTFDTGDGEPYTRYVCVKSGQSSLGESPDQALRFSRKQDAEAFAGCVLAYTGLVAKEHCWY